MQAIGGHADPIWLTMLMNKLEFFKMSWLDAGRKKMLEWYNQHSGRNVSMRTQDRIIRRLKESGEIKKIARTKDMGIHGKRFETSITRITKKGLFKLERLGVAAFDKIKEIAANRKPRKKKARKEDAKRARFGTAGQLSEAINKVMRLPAEK